MTSADFDPAEVIVLKPEMFSKKCKTTLFKQAELIYNGKVGQMPSQELEKSFSVGA